MPTPARPDEPHAQPVWAEAPEAPACEGWLGAALATTHRAGVPLCQGCAEDLDSRMAELP